MKNILFDGKLYPCKVWQSADGEIGQCSFDSETTLIEAGTVPNYVIGSAFNGCTVYFIKRNDVGSFLSACKSLYMANAAFDLAVAEKVSGTLRSLIEEDRVVDVLLLEQLANIADDGSAGGFPCLDALSERYLGIKLAKDAKDRHGKDIRTSFAQFLGEDGVVRYSEIPFEYLKYAGSDAIATYLTAVKLVERVKRLCHRFHTEERALLSVFLQIRASYALESVSRTGLFIDDVALDRIRLAVTNRTQDAIAQLKQLGWNPGGGSAKRLQEILGEMDQATSVKLPRTTTGRISSRAEDLAPYTAVPFIKCYLDFKESQKLAPFLKVQPPRIHPRFGTVVATGRTCSFSPNVQNYPRKHDIRSIFRPSPGYVFLDVDYSQIELVALAQITYRQFGRSRMMDLLNDGVDVHKYFAGAITGKPLDQISDEERRKAKACNFGFPGGLGVQGFILYAAANYGICLSEADAEQLKEAWLDSFPEVREYLCTDTIATIVNSGMLTDYPGAGHDQGAAWAFRRIVAGEATTSTTGREYSVDEIDWAFAVLDASKFPDKEEYSGAIRRRRGSYELWRAFSRSLCHISWPSGRVRSNIGYCDSKNNPFQGLAADGAKEALYALVVAGYRVVNFIHDEYLIEVALDTDLRKAQSEVESILIDAMNKHCPDVRVRVESKWMDRWGKDENLVLNEDGNLLQKP